MAELTDEQKEEIETKRKAYYEFLRKRYIEHDPKACKIYRSWVDEQIDIYNLRELEI